jgi:Holliday junction DNA helicase RuvA
VIGKLKGIVDAVGEAHVIIDVGGVGYEVQASARTLRALQMGEEVSLAIETHVREDAIRLYGFTSEVERAWFRTLQTIQGVGAKVALAVLGTCRPRTWPTPSPCRTGRPSSSRRASARSWRSASSPS